MNIYDVIVLGGGIAGLSATRKLLQRDKRVLIIDYGDKLARKLLISGGGKCNFTNNSVSYLHYFGQNPKFVISAINKIKPTDILHWMDSHKIEYFEKTPGQYFSVDGSYTIWRALYNECQRATILKDTEIHTVMFKDDHYIINNTYHAKSIIVATGGLSYPSLYVSDIGYTIAKQFNHKIIPVRAGLTSCKTTAFEDTLSGISLPVKISVETEHIEDDLLFTHTGLGGPAIYKMSLRDLKKTISINFLPNINIFDTFKTIKQTNGKKTIINVLCEYMPIKLAKWFGKGYSKHIADYKDSELQKLSNTIQCFPLNNLRFNNFDKAEVTIGGISTKNICSKTMESYLQPNLFFAGEVIDIAGDLGGFNIHWAVASGTVAGLFA